MVSLGVIGIEVLYTTVFGSIGHEQSHIIAHSQELTNGLSDMYVTVL